MHAEAGEPYRVSVRQLRRNTVDFGIATNGPEVFVCENPSVVDIAANRLGAEASPLVCIDGQPKTASRILLSSLAEAGCRLRYHGDFDWDGLRIGNKIMQRHNALSWRFNTANYLAAVSDNGHKLQGKPVAADWDSELANAMLQHGRCVHEEQVLDPLLTDLANS